MATLRELIIKISANSQSFQSEISRAGRMGQDYYRTMQNGGRQAATAQRETQRALSAVTAQLNTTRLAALSMTGAFAGAFATANLIRLADSYNSLSARVKLATTDASDFSTAQKGLMEISQRTGSAFADNAALFSRASTSLREWGFGTQDILKLTDALANGLQVSGASAEETSSLIVQLSQALGRGVLRGQDFNSVAQSGQRIMKALADGMGVAQKDLKGMADAGQLTTDKIVPALISQLDKLKSEFASMPNSVSAASTRIQNAFMDWVGGANNASGATATISGVMDDVSKNIDTVATAAGALVAVGVSRYFGNWTTALAGNTAELIRNYRSQVNAASAQLNAAQITQRKAVANADAASSAYNLARVEANIAKGTNAAVIANQNLIQKRKELIAANTALVQSNRAVAASQTALNRITSVWSLMGRGVSGLISLLGGIPGALMLGAGVWYAVYQSQEQARQSARAYADQIDEIREKTSKMTLPEVDSNRKQTVEAMQEQKRLIAEQEKNIARLKSDLDKINNTRGNSALNQNNEVDILKSIAILTEQISVEEEKLRQLREKSGDISRTIEAEDRRRNDLIKEQAWRQNDVYQNLVMMTGEYSRVNRLLGLGNQLLMERQGLVNVPLRMPQVTLDQKQTDALEKSRQELEQSKLKGEARERYRLNLEADTIFPKGDARYQTSRGEFIKNGLDKWRNDEANKPAKKGPKSDAEKAVDTYDRLIKQQKEQIALEGQNTELAKVKYQVSQGELATLSQAQKADLMRNAALIDQVKLREQLRNYEANLADSNASARAANEAQLTGYGQGTRFRERMQEQFNIRKEFEQKNTDLLRQRQAGDISERFYQQGLALNKRYLDERLRDQQGFYSASDAQRDDWFSGLSEGYANWADEATNYSALAADGMRQAMDGAVSSVTDMLNGNVSGWKDWGVSVLKIVQNVLVNMAMANAASSIGSLFSFGASSAAGSSGTAIQSAAANFKFNAKGDVYDSPSLSAYTNGVYSTPQYFAFAKGAGVFGEAGPEAIMPLTRAADGSLGVRAMGGVQTERAAPSINIGDIHINSQSQQPVSQGADSAAGRQLTDAILRTVNEEVSRPGTPLWRAIKGV
ncbi:phage tail tape measure protein [Superficieibacter sp. 1612_C1]|uniref:phage tail tape measure protein n=1 Tax=Superficieibacter sp. 1612_C1 TaxID=2780382 RepID=UPI001883B25A|nr:phage tail tape measure protein [Superficieibacter sp. 1612_C1]